MPFIPDPKKLVVDQARDLGGGNQRAGDGPEGGENVEFHQDVWGLSLLEKIKKFTLQQADDQGDYS